MSTLTDLAQTRLAMNLPDFPGSTLAEQLVNGRNAALAALKRYVPNFTFDAEASDAAVRSIDAWAERNEDGLTEAMTRADNDLVEAIRTELGSDKAQAFVLATFTNAAIGLGPWGSGLVDRMVLDPSSKIGSVWAQEDAVQRLQVFGSIVRMDQDGRLANIFVPPSSTSGFGALPVVWAIVVGTVLIAAVILTFVFVNGRMKANNSLMRELCIEAQKKGDVKTVEACLDSTKELQLAPLESLPGQLIKVAMIVGLVYVVVVYGIPKLRKKKKGLPETGSEAA